MPWLGKIPKHWEIRRGKSVFKSIDVRSKVGEEELLTVSSKDGVVPRREKNVTMFMAESYEGYRLCWPGDLVINSLWAWAGGLGFSRHHGIISSAYGVYRPKIEFSYHWKYFDYLLRSIVYDWEFHVRSKGIWVSRLQLTDPSFLDMPIVLPPNSDAVAIAQFLTGASARISRLIRTKRRLIELLNEQKQAIIHRAVTRGLDPNVRLKPSGIGWLGDVPEHWQKPRLKQVASILRGKFTHRPRNDPVLYDGPYPFIQTGAVAQANKFITSYKQTLNEKGLAVSKIFPRGTLVMTIAANIGEVAILDLDACFPDSVVGFVPKDEVDRDFLYYVLRNMKDEFLREAPVNTQGNLNIERIGAMFIPLAPLKEQIGIVVYIEKHTVDLNNTIDRNCREIDLIREYRTRLISDVVTGKLDVRSMELPKMDETETLIGIDTVEDIELDSEELIESEEVANADE